MIWSDETLLVMTHMIHLIIWWMKIHLMKSYVFFSRNISWCLPLPRLTCWCLRFFMCGTNVHLNPSVAVVLQLTLANWFMETLPLVGYLVVGYLAPSVSKSPMLVLNWVTQEPMVDHDFSPFKIAIWMDILQFHTHSSELKLVWEFPPSTPALGARCTRCKRRTGMVFWMIFMAGNTMFLHFQWENMGNSSKKTGAQIGFVVFPGYISRAQNISIVWYTEEQMLS